VALIVNLGEFRTADGAFGAYAQDRAPEGEPAAVGDEATVVGSAFWAKRGRYYVSVLPSAGGATPQQAAALGSACLGAAGGEAAARPAICRRLPKGGLDETSVRYVVHATHLQDVYVSDEVIGALGLSDASGGAYGTYGEGAGGVPVGLLLIEYASAAQAAAAHKRYIETVRPGGQEPRRVRDVHLVRVEEGHHTGARVAGRTLAVSLFVPDAERAAGLVEQARESGD